MNNYDGPQRTAFAAILAALVVFTICWALGAGETVLAVAGWVLILAVVGAMVQKMIRNKEGNR